MPRPLLRTNWPAGLHTNRGATTLLGRRGECAVLERVLEEVRAGRSDALVVRGEAGVGKTALLEHVVHSVPDLRVLRAVGVESEMELAFAALHALCAPLIDRLERLPGPQRDALMVTFGLSAGTVPDRLFVGLAVQSLLAEAAEKRPLLCVVDDAQWLDKASAETLAFVSRRLRAESVVMLFAARSPSEALLGLPELVMQGLQDAPARELLASVVPWSLDERVASQVVAETRGNPLALLALPRGLSPTQLAGGFGLPRALPVQARIEDRLLSSLEELPPDARQLLLLAAAEPVGDPALLWRAATRLGSRCHVLKPAVDAFLVVAGTTVRFRDPLVRSAVYLASSPEERREAHRALAEAIDAGADPARRAWHLAEATSGPDEQVAAELERTAGRAQETGGLAAAAAFLERATLLTPVQSVRADRALTAAQTMLGAGALDAVEGLLATAEAGPLDELQHARADLVRAQLTLMTGRRSDAVTLLVKTARRLEPVAPELARATYLEAFLAANLAGRLAVPGGSVADVAREVSAAPAHRADAGGLLLDGLSTNFVRGYAAGLPILRRALEASGGPKLADEDVGWLRPAFVAAVHLWDDEASETLSDRRVNHCRETGAVNDLPVALGARAVVRLLAGDLPGATTLVEEERAATEATGLEVGRFGAIGLAALRGDEAEALALFDSSVKEAEARGEGTRLSAAEWAKALLSNGLGRYPQALAAAQRASENRWELLWPNWALVELIEAAVRSREPDLGRRALERLAPMTGAAGTDWALGIEARCRGLLSDGDVAEKLYREAIERLGRTRVRVELARAHLLYGEWLRRERRRVDARKQLRTAYEMFVAMGVDAFAGRAERELLATGEHARKRGVDTRDELTDQEAQIARLARDGVCNAEIGERLFISRRTVEYHLSKVFTKLGIGSRHELARVLPEEPAAALTS
jgi:DNA-binding CsgD family transcriptional regulator/tetratricopeptide (TPR) repeat protein